MPRILIVDDHPIVRQGLRRVLTAAIPGLTVVETDSAARGLHHLHQHFFHLVILDLGLPDYQGDVALRKLRQSHPAVPVLVVSMYPSDQFAGLCAQAGAAGYVSKSSAPEEVVQAVQAVLAGSRYLPAPPAPAQGRQGRGGLPHEVLSDREYQVLRMIGEGRTVSEIASELSLSVKTVSTYRTRIVEKTGMRTNAELMRYVMQHRLTPWRPLSEWQ